MCRIAYILFFATIVNLSLAQDVFLERQVIGCFGANNTSKEIVYNHNGGEACIGTHSNIAEFSRLTSGFLQPSSIVELFDVQVVNTSCPENNDGSIVIKITNDFVKDETTFVWDNGEKGATIENLASGDYQVTIKYPVNKTIKRTITVATDEEAICDLIVQEILTPNEDNLNDIWYIEQIDNKQYKSNTVKIFNRWGDIVWETEGYSNSNNYWAGTNMNNETLPDGTYYYSINIGEKQIAGYVELLR